MPTPIFPPTYLCTVLTPQHPLPILPTHTGHLPYTHTLHPSTPHIHPTIHSSQTPYIPIRIPHPNHPHTPPLLFHSNQTRCCHTNTSINMLSEAYSTKELCLFDESDMLLNEFERIRY